MQLHRLTAPGRQVALLMPWLQRRQILPARVSRQTALVERLGLSAHATIPAATPAILGGRTASVAVPPVRRFLAPIRLPDQHSQADGAPLALAQRGPTNQTLPRAAEVDVQPRAELQELERFTVESVSGADEVFETADADLDAEMDQEDEPTSGAPASVEALPHAGGDSVQASPTLAQTPPSDTVGSRAQVPEPFTPDRADAAASEPGATIQFAPSPPATPAQGFAPAATVSQPAAGRPTVEAATQPEAPPIGEAAPVLAPAGRESAPTLDPPLLTSQAVSTEPSPLTSQAVPTEPSPLLGAAPTEPPMSLRDASAESSSLPTDAPATRALETASVGDALPTSQAAVAAEAASLLTDAPAPVEMAARPQSASDGQAAIAPPLPMLPSDDLATPISAAPATAASVQDLVSAAGTQEGDAAAGTQESAAAIPALEPSVATVAAQASAAAIPALEPSVATVAAQASAAAIPALEPSVATVAAQESAAAIPAQAASAAAAAQQVSAATPSQESAATTPEEQASVATAAEQVSASAGQQVSAGAAQQVSAAVPAQESAVASHYQEAPAATPAQESAMVAAPQHVAAAPSAQDLAVDREPVPAVPTQQVEAAGLTLDSTAPREALAVGEAAPVLPTAGLETADKVEPPAAGQTISPQPPLPLAAVSVTSVVPPSQVAIVESPTAVSAPPASQPVAPAPTGDALPLSQVAVAAESPSLLSNVPAPAAAPVETVAQSQATSPSQAAASAAAPALPGNDLGASPAAEPAADPALRAAASIEVAPPLPRPVAPPIAEASRLEQARSAVADEPAVVDSSVAPELFEILPSETQSADVLPTQISTGLVPPAPVAADADVPAQAAASLASPATSADVHRVPQPPAQPTTTGGQPIEVRVVPRRLPRRPATEQPTRALTAEEIANLPTWMTEAAQRPASTVTGAPGPAEAPSAEETARRLNLARQLGIPLQQLEADAATLPDVTLTAPRDTAPTGDSGRTQPAESDAPTEAADLSAIAGPSHEPVGTQASPAVIGSPPAAEPGPAPAGAQQAAQTSTAQTVVPPTAGAASAPIRLVATPAPAEPVLPGAQTAGPGVAAEQPRGSVIAIPQSTRRFLEPLVGIDPSSVHVYEAPHGAPETRGADGLTISDDIVLAAGQAGGSPQALGLLAHELTHVALARQGNVTPPIAQDPSAPDRPTANLDEESLARRVEARVVSAAETLAGPASSTAPTSTGPLQLTPKDLAPAGPGPVPSGPPEPVDAEPSADDIWGGLPKPWEPLPAWMTDASPAVGLSMANNFAPGWDSAPTNGTSAPAVAAAAPAAAPATAGGGAQMAEIGRAQENVQPEQHASQSTPGGPAAQVPPDLDALAQQVYTILRRRISAESRRFR